jgi:hypothetical protein
VEEAGLVRVLHRYRTNKEKREREREGMLYFKDLAHGIVAVGKANRAGWHARYPRKS